MFESSHDWSFLLMSIKMSTEGAAHSGAGIVVSNEKSLVC